MAEAEVIDTPFGALVTIALAPSTAAERRATTHAGGRVALKHALEAVGASVTSPIDTDDRGAPIVPQGFVGSIAHKELLACALAARDEGFRIGVDLEPVGAVGAHLEPRILTPSEVATLSAFDEQTRGHARTRRWVLKEALYKALDPFVRRHVAFHEVEVVPHADGTATFTLQLAQGERGLVSEGRWLEHEGYAVAMVRVRPTSAPTSSRGARPRRTSRA